MLGKSEMSIGDKVIVQCMDGDLVRGTWLEQTQNNVTIRTERGGIMCAVYVWVKKI